MAEPSPTANEDPSAYGGPLAGFCPPPRGTQSAERKPQPDGNRNKSTADYLRPLRVCVSPSGPLRAAGFLPFRAELRPERTPAASYRP